MKARIELAKDYKILPAHALRQRGNRSRWPRPQAAAPRQYAPRRSMAAPTTSTRTAKTPAPLARPSSVSTASTNGAKRLSIATASARPWSGQEAVTLVAATRVPDEAYEKVRAQFSEEEIKTLTLAITMINVWNRFSVAFRTVSGDYKPGMFRTVKAYS